MKCGLPSAPLCRASTAAPAASCSGVGVSNASRMARARRIDQARDPLLARRSYSSGGRPGGGFHSPGRMQRATVRTVSGTSARASSRSFTTLVYHRTRPRAHTREAPVRAPINSLPFPGPLPGHSRLGLPARRS